MNVKDKLNLYFKPNAVKKSLHRRSSDATQTARTKRQSFAKSQIKVFHMIWKTVEK